MLVVHLGIEFYLFVSHGGMNGRGSTCKFRNARGSSVFHTSMRNKQVEFNPYIYILSKVSRPRYSEQPAHTSRMFLHGKMDVKIFLMFIVAENTGSVNICT